MIFLDTSAIYALADAGDPGHQAARGGFARLLGAGERIVTHNYVLVESMALIQARLGLTPALTFAGDAAAFETHWVDEKMHREAVERLVGQGKRGVSLVDQVSFLLMRRRGIRVAFAFDADFEVEGFRLFPSR